MALFDSENWRQADGISIAKNFLTDGPQVLYPKIDHAGQLTGIVGCEFPLMNFMVFLLFKMFSVGWWQGRLVNLVFSSLGTYYFYQLVHRFLSRKMALPAAIILITSIWFAHSRKFMPDVLSTSLVIMGVYCGLNFLKKTKGNGWLVGFILFVASGMLSKIPSAIVLAFIIPEMFNPQVEQQRKYWLLTSLIVVFIPVVLWYFYWVPHLTKAYGYSYFYMGSSMIDGFKSLLLNLPDLLAKFYYDAMHFIAFGFVTIGLWFLYKNKEWVILKILGIACVLLAIYLLKAGEHVIIHSYYLIPFIPFMAITAAYSIIQFKQLKVQRVIVALIVLEGIGNQQHDFRYSARQIYHQKLAYLANDFIPKDKKIVVNYGYNPTMLGFLDRKGWTKESSFLADKKQMDELINANCAFLVWDNHQADIPGYLSDFELLYQDEDYLVCKLK